MITILHLIFLIYNIIYKLYLYVSLFYFFLFLLVPSYELINSDARHDSVDWITCICYVVVDCGSTRCDSTDHCSRLSHLCHCMKLSHFTCIFEFFFLYIAKHYGGTSSQNRCLCLCVCLNVSQVTRPQFVACKSFDHLKM